MRIVIFETTLDELKSFDLKKQQEYEQYGVVLSDFMVTCYLIEPFNPLLNADQKQHRIVGDVSGLCKIFQTPQEAFDYVEKMGGNKDIFAKENLTRDGYAKYFYATARVFDVKEDTTI